jgi:hypothetical protein
MKNVFNTNDSDEILARINNLSSTSQPLWGKMGVAQMLAHSNVTYEMVFENKHPKPNFFMKLMLQLFIKKIVVSEGIYKHNSQTAPAFIIKEEKNFDSEKNHLIEFINKTQQLGANHFNGKESHSFGKLTDTEWNNMFYKHLDHHLRQFGV